MLPDAGDIGNCLSVNPKESNDESPTTQEHAPALADASPTLPIYLPGAEFSKETATDTLDDESASGRLDGETETAAPSSELNSNPVVELLTNVFCTTNDRLFLLSACTIAFVVLTVRYNWLAWQKPEPVQWERGSNFAAFKVEVNSADWVDWMQLEGIGRETAVRIVQDRDSNGPFLSIDDVGRVDGIGPTTLDRIRDQLTIGNEQERKSYSESGIQSENRLDKSDSRKQQKPF